MFVSVVILILEFPRDAYNIKSKTIKVIVKQGYDWDYEYMKFIYLNCGMKK